MKKMYPEGTSQGDALMAQLEAAQEPSNERIFSGIRADLEALYKTGLPDGKEEILAYQSQIDSLIQRVGNALGDAAETFAQYKNEGRVSNDWEANDQLDMLVMAMTLNELQNLRRESVRHKYRSSDYDGFCPADLKKIEGLEQKVRG